MHNPLVSILIPAYNVENYIPQCLDSVIGQSYGNLQIIIVDDGSKDSTGWICDKYAGMDPRIEVYHIPNGGVANARNILLSKIKGEYFLFVDADDWIEPKCIETLITIALKESIPLVVFNSSEPTQKTYIFYDHKTAIEEFIRHRKLNGMLWNKLIHHNVIAGINFDPSISYGEDALFIWQVLQRCNKIIALSQNFYHHRILPTSLSASKFDGKKMSSHKVWKRIYEDTLRLWPEYTDLAKANYGVCDFWLLYFAAKDSYHKDENVMAYQKHLKKELPLISRLNLLSRDKIAFAHIVARNYALGELILKLLRS